MKDCRVLECPVHRVSLAEAGKLILDAVRTGGRCRVASLNPEIAINAGGNPRLMQALHTADLVIPDGTGIVIALWAQRQRVFRVTGVDLAETVMQRLAKQHGRIYLLGGRPGVSDRAARLLLQRFPGLVIAGQHHGYFAADQEPLVVRAIRTAQPHILLVGMGSPRQEVWLADHWEGLDVPVGICVGGGIDLWAGLFKRAPLWLRYLGLEWLYRVYQEPARLSRLKFLPVFLYRAFARTERRLRDGV